jgi:hypothetical protein
MPLVWPVVTLPLVKRYLCGARNYKRSLWCGYCIVIIVSCRNCKGNGNGGIGGVDGCGASSGDD